MKRWGLALLCAGILCLSACSREGDGGQSGEKEAVSGEDGSREGEPAPEKVVMTYQVTKGSIIDELEDVERAVNEISVPAIGVEVEFKVIDAQEAFSRYPLWISNREPVDLMVLNYQDITRYMDRGMLRSLDDILYEYGTDILAVSEERYDLTRGAVLNRFTYGVVAAQAYQGGGMGIILPKRYVEETGLSYDPSHVYTPEELTEWFAALKKLYPDRYPLGVVTAGNIYSIQSFFMEAGEGVAGESTSGNLLDSSEMKIYDRYTSEAYREFLGYIRQWYESGYLYPDGALTDYTVEELILLGKICAYPAMSVPENIENGYFPEEMACLRTTEVSVSNGHSKGGFWVIPSTSEHAEAAMKFLNLMYADASVVNLIQWGIRGRHYEVTDEENGLIAWTGGGAFGLLQSPGSVRRPKQGIRNVLPGCEAAEGGLRTGGGAQGKRRGRVRLFLSEGFRGTGRDTEGDHKICAYPGERQRGSGEILSGIPGGAAAGGHGQGSGGQAASAGCLAGEQTGGRLSGPAAFLDSLRRSEPLSQEGSDGRGCRQPG